MTTMTDSEAVINVLYDYDCQNSEEWNGDFRLPIEEPPERSQKLQRNFGVRHQEDKSHVLRRQGIMWLPVKLEDFSRSPSYSAVSHIKQVATQERDNTSARGVLLRPFLNNGYRLRRAVMSQFFFTF